MIFKFKCLMRCVPIVVRRRHFLEITYQSQKATFSLDTRHYSNDFNSRLENENIDDPDFEGETDPFLRNEIKRFNVGK